MEIVRLAEPCPAPRMRPVAAGLALVLNGGLLTLIALSRHGIPSHEDGAQPIDVELITINPKSEPPVPKIRQTPADAPTPEPDSPPKTSAADKPASAPRPGSETVSAVEKSSEKSAPALWNLVCTQIPAELRDPRPECREAGDPFAARQGPVTAGGLADQGIRERPLGDLMGGRFAGKDRYQIEVMLGLRSTSLGTKYHVPVDHGPADEPVDHTDTDRIIGPSPIPDG